MSSFEAGVVRSLFSTTEWLYTTYTSYTVHLIQHTPGATATTSHILVQNCHVIQGAWVCPLLIVCSSTALLLATTEGTVLRPGLYCICAEAGASDLHQAHLLPLPAAAAKSALTAQRAHHVVDSHSACHLRCWLTACSAGGCCCHTCLGQPCRGSNSHAEHCRTARYAAQCKPMCVSVSDNVLGLIGGWKQICMWAVSRQTCWSLPGLSTMGVVR